MKGVEEAGVEDVADEEESGINYQPQIKKSQYVKINIEKPLLIL